VAPSPTQLAWRGRIEAGLRVVEPLLDLVLAAGDRVSRIVEPRDLDHVPARPVGALAEARARASETAER
jgi:hypothetical protein